MNKTQAESLINEAEKTIIGGFFSNMFTHRTRRLENALDIFYKTGNQCKDAKLWKEAGYCFNRCGEIEEELGAESASQFQTSAYCYSFIDINSK